jgi:hypothetical protein
LNLNLSSDDEAAIELNTTPPATFVSALQAIHTVMKYFIKFDVVDNMIVAVLLVVTRTRCTDFSTKQRSSNFNGHVEVSWITFVM